MLDGTTSNLAAESSSATKRYNVATFAQVKIFADYYFCSNHQCREIAPNAFFFLKSTHAGSRPCVCLPNARHLSHIMSPYCFMLLLRPALSAFQSVFFSRAYVKDIDSVQQRLDATIAPRNIPTLLALKASRRTPKASRRTPKASRRTPTAGLSYLSL